MCGGLTLTGHHLPTKAALLLSWTHNKKIVGGDKNRETALTSYCHVQNRLNLRK